MARMFGPVNVVPEETASALGSPPNADGTPHLIRPEALAFADVGLDAVVKARRYRGTGYMAEVTLKNDTALLVATPSAPTAGTAVKVAMRQQ